MLFLYKYMLYEIAFFENAIFGEGKFKREDILEGPDGQRVKYKDIYFEIYKEYYELNDRYREIRQDYKRRFPQ